MFKELFVTGLLSFTVGSTPLKYTAHNLSNNGIYSLQGCYCFNDTVDNKTNGVLDDGDSHQFYIYSYTDYEEGNYDVYGYWYFNKDFITVRSFYVLYRFDGDYSYFSFSCNLGEESVYENDVEDGESKS